MRSPRCRSPLRSRRHRAATTARSAAARSSARSRVLGAGRYTHDGKGGTFTAGASTVKFPDKISGWTLRFKGGLDDYNGRWYNANGGPGRRHVPEIALKNPTDGFESILCDV